MINLQTAHYYLFPVNLPVQLGADSSRMAAYSAYDNSQNNTQLHLRCPQSRLRKSLPVRR